MPIQFLMDAGNLRLAEGLVQRAYLRQATEAKNSRVGLIRILLSQVICKFFFRLWLVGGECSACVLIGNAEAHA